MSQIHLHPETHLIKRIGWLRAAVLGANDGIISIASLMIGMAAADVSHHNLLIAGASGIVAGAMSMAAGEYVSVSSQSDTEKFDLARERRELAEQPDAEREELAQIYVERGLTEALAREVAIQLMQKDALAAHAREELGISEITTARPIQAALASAASFIVGAILPLLTAFLCPIRPLVPVIATATLVFLSLLGAIGAHTGGANIFKGMSRVLLWGALAMAITALIGQASGAIFR